MPFAGKGGLGRSPGRAEMWQAALGVQSKQVTHPESHTMPGPSSAPHSSLDRGWREWEAVSNLGLWGPLRDNQSARPTAAPSPSAWKAPPKTDPLSNTSSHFRKKTALQNCQKTTIFI